MLPLQKIDEFHEIDEMGELRLGLSSHRYEVMNFMEWMKSVKSNVWCPPILRIDEFHEIDEIDEVRDRLCFQSKIKVKNENTTFDQ